MDWNTIADVALSVVMLVVGWALREWSAKLDHRRGLETVEHQEGIVREAQKVAAVGRTLEFLLRVHHVLTVERIIAEEGPRLVQRIGSDNDEFKLLRGWLHSLGAHIVGSPEEFEAHLDRIAESRPLLAHRLRTFPYVLEIEGLLESLVQQIGQIKDVDLDSATHTLAGYSGRTWAPVPGARGHRFRSTWAPIPEHVGTDSGACGHRFRSMWAGPERVLA